MQAAGQCRYLLPEPQASTWGWINIVAKVAYTTFLMAGTVYLQAVSGEIDNSQSGKPVICTFRELDATSSLWMSLITYYKIIIISNFIQIWNRRVILAYLI